MTSKLWAVTPEEISSLARCSVPVPPWDAIEVKHVIDAHEKIADSIRGTQATAHYLCQDAAGELRLLVGSNAPGGQFLCDNIPVINPKLTELARMLTAP